MAVLTSTQRSRLETAVINAREISQLGAYNSLHALAADEPEPYAHMTPEQRALRNRLRSKARLLGDELPSDGRQVVTNISYELAYEYWHKMLFARFLEANNLLMHTSGVPVTMNECEELAHDEGFTDKWAAAAFYASRMLPAIFRIEDPVMLVEYSPDDRIKLETLLDGIEENVFSADDALGWVYQFWQSKAKADINASGDKIDGSKLPAVTQLFTEPYMVHFLIDNTLGAWWVSRNPGIQTPAKFEYLRLMEDGTPAAGNFEGWPNTTAEITTLDPCMGSGHFVVSLYLVMVKLRMYEENLTADEATDRVISENLHGLELDNRCTQLAAFNLALTAWKFCGHYRGLPEMNLACSGIAPKGKKEDWVKLVGNVADPVEKARMENGMQILYSHFQLAPELGSLLDPSAIRPDAFVAGFDQLKPILKQALANEQDKDILERGVIAAGIAKAGEILSKKFTLQITNVPYLNRGKQDKIMSVFCENNYPEAKGDLATVFMDKMLKSNSTGGISCSVILQNWLFLTSYKKLREKLLKNETWCIVARLGVKAFQTPMWDFNVMLISISRLKPTPNQILVGIDVSEALTAAAKAEALKTIELKPIKQIDQLSNPDARIVMEDNTEGGLLKQFAFSHHGLVCGDRPRMCVNIWEIITKSQIWIHYCGTVSKSIYFGGKDTYLRWCNGKGAIKELKGATNLETHAWDKKGVVISAMGNLPATLYTGMAFDNNTAVITANNPETLPAIWCFCSSPHYNNEVRKIDQKLNVTNATLVKVPIDLDYWQKISSEKYPNGLPKPYSNDPTQWLFHGNPIKAINPLQVAFARLIGYHWPAENDAEMELADEARVLIASIKAFDHLSDEDGIVCIPSVNGETAGADRLREYIQEVWGSQWNNQTIEQLLTASGSSKTKLEDWLREEFFVQHCKLFQNRPFIWHIWDGRKDGFGALVNYHKLTKANLQKLIYTYLGDYILQWEARLRDGESGADGMLSAARKLKERLLLILDGEQPYDIFIRWKKLEEQPIGWDPDLNDGVRLNIRPFIEAGVLRAKFNIKWGIDRGKNPPNSPWGEIRDNDKHLSLEEKRKARENK
jgi:hypothetical protein